jgi:hypothetical protein
MTAMVRMTEDDLDAVLGVLASAGAFIAITPLTRLMTVSIMGFLGTA